MRLRKWKTNLNLHQRHVAYVVNTPPIRGPTASPRRLTAGRGDVLAIFQCCRCLGHSGDLLPIVIPINACHCQQGFLELLRYFDGRIDSHAYRAVSLWVAQLDTMVIEPLAMPAAPRPAMSRPAMNIAEETAAPHRTDPTSKMAKKTKNAH